MATSDNDWNNVATDSLINFETVKYFTAEEFEKDKFAEADVEIMSPHYRVNRQMLDSTIPPKFVPEPPPTGSGPPPGTGM